MVDTPLPIGINYFFMEFRPTLFQNQVYVPRMLCITVANPHTFYRTDFQNIVINVQAHNSLSTKTVRAAGILLSQNVYSYTRKLIKL